MKLKAVDAIGVVGTGGSCEGCIFYNSPGKCEMQCRGENIIFVLRDGPKQGDTVWGRNRECDKWLEYTYSTTHDGVNVCLCKGYTSKFTGCKYITTEDPYALKYALTPQEALIAIGQGKVVEEGLTGKRLKYCEAYPTFIGEIGDIGLFRGSLTCRCMYAIVGEE